MSELLYKMSVWLKPRLHNAVPTFFLPQQHLRLRVYCIGAPKTGTTTLARLFQPQFRATHEAEASLMLAKLLQYMNTQDSGPLLRYLRHRDRRLGLEMDSSHLYYPILKLLVAEFADAKFILTIRDCYSWLDSLLNHHAALYAARGNQWKFRRAKWIRYYDTVFGAKVFRHVPEEQVLSAHNLYTLDGYFRYWASHNQTAMSLIPPERLLVLKTTEIDEKLPEIESFLQLPRGTFAKPMRSNVRDTSQKLNLLARIDSDFVERKAQQYCQTLMQQYFPTIQGLRDLCQLKV